MVTIYQTKEKSSCFLSNINTKTDVNVNFGDINYSVPAWSISILPNCREEAYNTAKVNPIFVFRVIIITINMI
ncbi:hypothetical protein ERO13_D13G196310v2 [Gossypium hirsutum]|nr:hypothetical protein ERO13_D13G196310v2 [Gossypium hirsutum]